MASEALPFTGMWNPITLASKSRVICNKTLIFQGSSRLVCAFNVSMQGQPVTSARDARTYGLPVFETPKETMLVLSGSSRQLAGSYSMLLALNWMLPLAWLCLNAIDGTIPWSLNGPMSYKIDLSRCVLLMLKPMWSNELEEGGGHHHHHQQQQL